MPQELINTLPVFLLAIICMVFLVTVVGLKYNKIKSIIAISIYTILICLINFFIFRNKTEYNQTLYLVSIFIPEAILVFIIGTKKRFSFAVAIINCYIAFYLVLVTRNIVFAKWTYLWLEYLVYIFASLFVCIFLKIFYNKLHKEIEYCTPHYMPLFGAYALAVFLIITLYSLYIQSSTSKRVLRLDMFAFAMIGSYVLSIFFFYFIFNRFKNALISQSDNQILAHQLERINMANIVREEKEKELRILRHDVRHILSTTSSLIKSNNLDEALKFIEKYTTVLESNTEEFYCKDPIINSVIDYYKKKCDSNNIPINIKINNIEDALIISSHEVAVLIANCLDNAYNAVSKLNKNKFIEFTFLNNDGRLVLQIKNSYNGKIILDKDNKPTNLEIGHGIGTSSIERFANKYNLLLNYEINKNIFSISILFKAD